MTPRVLLPAARDADVYARTVHEAGRGGLHRTQRIEYGTHTDSPVDVFPDRLRPSCRATAPP
ncbi:hypothetical protein [Streptomyces sp. AM 2-1-1]|uniref:hypothetical protein n=1 Tax=unclassified Streptomyces TaxID=2593676 RepID=UPI0031BABD22